MWKSVATYIQNEEEEGGSYGGEELFFSWELPPSLFQNTTKQGWSLSPEACGASD